MCGRFTLSKPVKQVADLFALPEPPPELRPRYNVAPSQVVAVVGLKPDGRTRGLALLQWGLIPSWAPDPKKALKPINARAETLTAKPTFRDSFRSRRCLIPADGFYEWQRVGKAKKPHHIRLKGGGLFAFAGLWDSWTDGTQKATTCCVITTAANELVKPLHDRMPAILTPADFDAWLDPRTPAGRLTELLRPYPAGEMEVVPVGPQVNAPANDGPECLTPTA